ncbi:porphobilinogen synthase, partial [Tritonibacter sp. SIMBA_163]
PGSYRYTLDLLLAEVKEASKLGICAIALFPALPEEKKDATGTESYNPNGLIQRTIRAIKETVPEMIVITDVALDPFSDQGHD